MSSGDLSGLSTILDVLERVYYTAFGAIKDIGHLINVQDVEEWEEDEDEYVRKNLPSELVGFLVIPIIGTYVFIGCV